jgi:hypothetical protein
MKLFYFITLKCFCHCFLGVVATRGALPSSQRLGRLWRMSYTHFRRHMIILIYNATKIQKQVMLILPSLSI